MIRQSKASARWNGGLKDGKGTLSAESGVLSSVAYNFGQRFEQAPGTNPEELIAAAHAACFAMALASDLGKAGLSPQTVDARATISLDSKDGKPTVVRSHIECTAKVPGASAEAFQKVAEGTKAGCPVSRALNAEITLDAKLA